MYGRFAGTKSGRNNEVAVWRSIYIYIYVCVCVRVCVCVCVCKWNGYRLKMLLLATLSFTTDYRYHVKLRLASNNILSLYLYYSLYRSRHS